MVNNYEIKMSIVSTHSLLVRRRQAMATKIMQQISKTPRDPFRVDPQHAGTIENNFITKALQPRFDDILGIVAEEVIRSI